MTTFNFKSVGKTQDQVVSGTIESSPIPFGIKTPMQLGSSDGIFAMNYSLEDQFADNLRNLLLTNWGERVGLHQFGANLKPLTTEFVSQDDFDSQAVERIKHAVDRWMPFIDLEEFISTVDRNENKNTAIIKINVTYNIPALEVYKKGVQIVMYVI